MRGYLLAVDDYVADDVTAAVDSFIKGIAPGVNPNFLPTAASVGAECRRQLNLRLDRENRIKATQPKLIPPDIEKSPEERARMKAKLDEFLAKSAAQMRVVGDEADEKARAVLRKTNERFAPDMDDDEVHKRLGFTAGDPEDAADAA